MRWSDRRLWFISIFLLGLLGLTLAIAPNSQQSSGSTYSRDPDGYGAWYAYMEQRGNPIKRWQKPADQLLNPRQAASSQSATLLQIHSKPTRGFFDEEWVKQGNTLIMLGVHNPVTEANFITVQKSPVGDVQIATRRRYPTYLNGQPPTQPTDNQLSNETTLLGDRFGAIVWQKKVGKGQVILCTTPFLAANAYQGAPGNFKFLAELVTQAHNPIWVDEYLHGYKDPQDIKQETANNWFIYLAKTPLLPLFFQAVILLTILIWAQNHRFGQAQSIVVPKIDNSMAYIQALASVLHKAQSSEFALAMIGKEEQLQIQAALGLGRSQLEPETLLQAWTTQTDRPAEELYQALLQYTQPSNPPKRMSDQELLIWMANLRNLRQHLPK
ncbi:MAG: DUF4350 domain-containing protein [Scytolyngbya sp. HA4215-MV1]|jgi:hypothetical protein|nr:DUF4350 domain-containing protein [Scytolyngbya sp. HA4215-MV1]